jgi:hypothetical protein
MNYPQLLKQHLQLDLHSVRKLKKLPANSKKWLESRKRQTVWKVGKLNPLNRNYPWLKLSHRKKSYLQRRRSVIKQTKITTILTWIILNPFQLEGAQTSVAKTFLGLICFKRCLLLLRAQWLSLKELLLLVTTIKSFQQPLAFNSRTQ